MKVKVVVLFLMLIAVINGEDFSERSAMSENGIVASARKEASQVGVEILEKGGNAIDAAVATAFAIGVLEPNASGIGGGGFMLLRLAKTGETKFIDYREVAPKDISLSLFEVDEKGNVLNNETKLGGKAVATPGNVAGLLTALEKYGTMNRVEVIKPAVKYAKEGIVVTKHLSEVISDSFESLSTFQETANIYLNDGLPFEEGEILVQKELGDTLDLIIEQGKDGFYKGDLAKKIANEVQEQGGVLKIEDLESYKVNIKDPIVGSYRDYSIISAPPSSSGGAHVIQLLNIIENYDLSNMKKNSAEEIHLWSESLKQVFLDRRNHMGDDEFVEVPLTGLITKGYAKKLSENIDSKKSNEYTQKTNPYKYESGSTTHISVIDKEGNMVALTQTINKFFGSGITVPKTGILLNNEIDDFSFLKGSKNIVGGGKRPLSSMTPTLVLDKENNPYISIGSPGATRIIPTVALVLSNIIDYKMNIQEAINMPRIAQFETGELKLEKGILEKDIEELKEKGHKIEVKGEMDSYFGGVQGVVIDNNNIKYGGADPRRDGKAIGY